MSTKELQLQESQLVILEQDELAINHNEDLAEITRSGKISPGILFLSLKSEQIKDMVFLDDRGQQISESNFSLFRNQTFIRNPFRDNVFHLFNSSIYEQFEQERFFHFKEVAHLLGLKHYELYKEDKEEVENSIKAALKGVLPIEGERRNNRIAMASFFTEEEYWPLQNNPDMTFFKQTYEKAKQYASKCHMEHALDFKDLFLSRMPENNPAKTKIIRYSYLSCISSCFKLAMNLTAIQKLIAATWPPAQFFPTGFSFEKTSMTIQEQLVSLKLDFFNFSNANLPVWDSNENCDNRYSIYINDRMETEKNKFVDSFKKVKEEGMLNIPEAEEYISPKEKEKKQIKKIRTCIGELQDNKKTGTLTANLFNELRQHLNFNFRYEKEELSELKSLFEKVFYDAPDDKSKSNYSDYKENIDIIKKAFQRAIINEQSKKGGKA